MSLMLQRVSQNPLLKPNPLHEWEALNVFNPAVVHHNGLFHMFYRAQGIDYTSSIGYAVSHNGLMWMRLDKPVLAPQDGDDYRGVEDPRVTEIDGVFYMAYTAYGKHSFFPMFARSHNLIQWERIAPLERAENKDHVLFPEKIDGRFVTFHRRPPDIWLAYSHDLLHWEDHQVVMQPRTENEWDCKRIGAGGVPIKTNEGWLMIYHAYDHSHTYRLGAALLDLENPTKVISRPKPFIFAPHETWELKGDVSNVVFSCANPVVDNTVYVYYGGADRVIGLATVSLDELLYFVKRGS